MATDGVYTIVIGETGSGKSTFINYLANYFKRGDLDDLRIAIPTRFHRDNMKYGNHEQALDDVTKSKTTECSCYTFGLKQMDFHFIDTPGINDTNGLLQDNKNIDKIFSYIETLPHINAVILTMNGAVSRVTINVQNVLTKFKDRLPDIVHNNMLVILTNCEVHTVNFNVTQLGLPNRHCVFYMQNSAFSSNPTEWSFDIRQIMKNQFGQSMDTINDIVKTLCELKPQSITAFKDMDDDRNTIKRDLHDARLMLIELQNLEDELFAFETSSNIHADNANKFRDFVRCTPMIRIQRINTPFHNTTCSVCNVVCHKKCNLKEVRSPGHKYFSHCLVMEAGHCSKCPGKCRSEKHYHDRTVLQPVECKIEEVVGDLEQRYIEAKAGKEKAEVKCNDIQKMKKAVEQELQKHYSKISARVHRLQQTCTSFNIAAELFDFVECLTKEAERLRSPSVIEKAQNFVLMLKRLSNDINSTTSQAKNNQLSSTQLPSQSSPNTQHNTDEDHLAKDNDPEKRKSKATQSVERKQENILSSQSMVEKSPIAQQREFTTELRNENDKLNEFAPAQSNPVKKNDDQESQFEQNDKCSLTSEDQSQPKAHAEEPNYKSYTLSGLIDASKTCKNKAILRELRLRTEGKSVGLLNTNEQLDLCQQFTENRGKELTELIRLKESLKEEIRDNTDEDPLNIERVHPNKLLRLAAIKLLIFDATRNC